jgi:hypothetical protein
MKMRPAHLSLNNGLKYARHVADLQPAGLVLSGFVSVAWIRWLTMTLNLLCQPIPLIAWMRCSALLMA